MPFCYQQIVLYVYSNSNKTVLEICLAEKHHKNHKRFMPVVAILCLASNSGITQVMLEKWDRKSGSATCFALPRDGAFLLDFLHRLS
jgi:hypothetical protein